MIKQMLRKWLKVPDQEKIHKRIDLLMESSVINAKNITSITDILTTSINLNDKKFAEIALLVTKLDILQKYGCTICGSVDGEFHKEWCPETGLVRKKNGNIR